MTTVSVIVLRGGADDDLRACLDALQRVVAGDESVEILVTGRGPRNEADRAPAVEVRRVAAEIEEPADALNRAASEASGAVLLFMRAHTLAGPAMVSRHLEVHGGGAGAVGVGMVDPANGEASNTAPAAGSGELPLYAAVGHTISVGAVAFRELGFVTGAVDWGWEIDLLYRLRQRGSRLRQIEETVGRRVRPASVRTAAAERLRAGRGSVALYRRTPALLPELELGRFHTDNPPGLWLRRLLLGLGGHPIPAGLPVPPSWRGRWLRFEHDYHFWRGVRQALGTGPVWRGLLRPPVILMYHAVGAESEAPACYIVPLARFRRQLAWLAWRGYRIIGLEELLDYRARHEPPPARSVVITFDDGYADNRRLALAALRERGFPATFFLVSGYIGRRNTWDTGGELADRDLLSWDDVRALLDAGMEVGAHTRTHPVLPDLPAGAMEDELRGSRADLEAPLGRPIRTFAYPFGRLDAPTTAAVARSGFEGACCSRSGVNDPAVPPFLLRRVEVQGTDSLLRFALATHRGWVARRRHRP